MPVYLYAICNSTAEAPSGAGRDGQHLRMVASDGLAVLLSDRDGVEREPDEAALWEHERVVERLMQTHDLLPARFGSTLSGDEEVLKMLDERREEFRAALRRVAGAVELAVRAGWAGANSSGKPVGPEDGAEYLVRALERQREARKLSLRVGERLDPIARDRRVELQARANANVALRGSYLVARGSVQDFAREASALDEEIDDAEIICTGPWPPYSFTAPGRVFR